MNAVRPLPGPAQRVDGAERADRSWQPRLDGITVQDGRERRQRHTADLPVATLRGESKTAATSSRQQDDHGMERYVWHHCMCLVDMLGEKCRFLAVCVSGGHVG